MEGIVPEVRRNSHGQLFSPETVRAQKFRERAKSVSIGKPEFRLSQKKSAREDIYKTLENHPNFQDYSQMEEKTSQNENSQSNSDNKALHDLEKGLLLETAPGSRTEENSPAVHMSPSTSVNQHYGFRRKSSDDRTHSTANEGLERTNSMKLSRSSTKSGQNIFAPDINENMSTIIMNSSTRNDDELRC
jgi:hypothetical protein